MKNNDCKMRVQNVGKRISWDIIMEDQKIIELFFLREEQAIQETKNKYGNYCKKIAVHILQIPEDVEECESDTYMKLWESIPPRVPNFFKGYIGKIARNLSIQKYRYYHAEKRNRHMECVIEEIEESVATLENVESEIVKQELIKVMNQFLEELSEESRIIFIRRYWRMEPIKNICKEMKFSKSKVETNLSRTRKKLKIFLEQEGYDI